MAHELPPLPYAYAALEPTIDEKTMHLHHDMHHAAYVKNLNAALDKHPELHAKSPEDLIRDLNAIPEDIRGAVRNNGGGHVNHSMFWETMKPNGGGDPTGPIADVIKKTFGDFKTFQEKFNAAGVGQFGSAAIGGWVETVSDVDLILVVPDCATDEDTDRLRSEVPCLWPAGISQARHGRGRLVRVGGSY